MGCGIKHARFKDTQLSRLMDELETKFGYSPSKINFVNMKIQSPEFLEAFGDWINTPLDKMVEVFGDRISNDMEPKLESDGKNNYFFLDKNRNKIWIINEDFPGINPNDLDNISKAITLKIISNNGDLSFGNIESLRLNLDEEIQKVFDEMYEQDGKNPKVRSTLIKLGYVPKVDDPDFIKPENDRYKRNFYEFRKRIILEFADINILYKEDPDDTSQYDNDYNKDLEEDEVVEVMSKKSSLEVNLKENATSRIKLFLSSIVATTPEIIVKNNDYGYNVKYDLNTNLDLPTDRDVIWNLLQSELSGISTYRDPNNPDSFISIREIFIKKLANLRKFHSIVIPVYDRFIAMPEYMQIEFIQTFNKALVNLRTMEINPKDSEFTMKSFSATEFTSKANTVLEEWSNNLESLLEHEGEHGEVTVSINKVKELANLGKVFKSYFAKYIADISVADANKSKGLNAIYPNYSKFQKDIETNPIIVEYLAKVGIEINSNSLSYLVKDIEDSVDKMKHILSTLTSVSYVFSDIGNIKDSGRQSLDDVLLSGNPITSRESIRDLAKTVAAFKYDKSDHTVLTADGKTLWVYSYMGYLDVKVSNFKNNPSLLEEELAKPVNSESQLIKYLLGLDIQDKVLITDYINTVGMKIEELEARMDKYKQDEDTEKYEALKSLIASNTIIRAKRAAESRQRIKNFRIETFNMLQDAKHVNMYDNSSEKYGNALMEDIYHTLFPVRQTTGEYKSNPIYSGITPVDKSRRFMFKGAPFFDVEYLDGNLNEEILDIFFGYFKAFINEARSAANLIESFADSKGEINKKKLKVNYHMQESGDDYIVMDDAGLFVGNAFHSTLFPSLNFLTIEEQEGISRDELFEYKNVPKAIEDLSPELIGKIRNIIHRDLVSLIEKSKKTLISKKIINVETYGKDKDKTKLSRALTNAYPSIDSLVSNYIINGLISKIEFTNFFLGGAGYYKGLEDLIKRAAGPNTDGIVPVIGLEKDDWKLNITIGKTSKLDNTAYLNKLKQFNSLVPEEDRIDEDSLETWSKKSDPTDGGAYITPQRWFWLMHHLGMGNEYVDDIMKKINSRQSLTPEEINYVISTMNNKAQPLKGVYFNNDKYGPVYLKYSLMVLLPDLVSGTGLEKLYNKMVYGQLKPAKNPLPYYEQVHEHVLDSAAKTGSILPEKWLTDMPGTNSLSGPKKIVRRDLKLNKITLDGNYWKLQQSLPTKGLSQRKVGSQVLQVVLDGLAGKVNFNNDPNFKETYYRDVDGSEITATELYWTIHRISSTIADRGKESFIKKYSISEDGAIKNTEVFYNALIQEFKNRDPLLYEDVIKALEKRIPIDSIVSSRKKAENIFFSVANKYLTKIKTNAMGAIQASSAGMYFDKAFIKKQKIRLFVEIDQLTPPIPEYTDIQNEDGTVTKKVRIKPGQVFISHSMLEKIIPNYHELTNEQLKKIFANPNTRKIIGYRIPTQGMSSVDSFEVVGILPPGYGDTIIPYAEITHKTGSDFDIDKIYLMSPNIMAEYKQIQDFNDAKMLETLKFTNDEIMDILEENDIQIDPTLSLGVNLLVNRFKLINSQDKESQRLGVELSTFLGKNKKFKEGSLYKFVRFKYIKFNKKKEIFTQDTKALQNRLIELYRTILESEHTFKNVIRPLDATFIKDFVKKYYVKSEYDPFEFYSPINQIDIRFSYLQGKILVGITANHEIDHIQNQAAGLPFQVDIGNTITVEREDGSTITMSNLDQEYDSGPTRDLSQFRSKRYKITDIISAFLNAAVDIGKDDYITRANVNTITGNVMMFLVRSGQPVEWNLAFIGQPALRKYVNTITSDEGIGYETIRTEQGIKLSPIKQVLEYYKNKIDKNTKIPETLEKIQFNQLESELIKMKENPNYEGDPILQYQIMLLYESLSNHASLLQDLTQTTKVASKGMGNTTIQAYILYNKIQKYKKDISNKIRPFNIEDTLVGTLTNNSILWIVDNVLNNSGLFLSGKDGYKNILDMASNIRYGENLLNEEFGKEFDTMYYSFILSDFFNTYNGVKLNHREILRKYFSRNSALIQKIEQLQKDKTLSPFAKEFIDNLEIRKYRGMSVIKMSGRNKSSGYIKSLRRGMYDLYFSSNEMHRNLAKELYMYTYYASGLGMTSNHLFRAIPHEIIIDSNMHTEIAQELKNLDVLEYQLAYGSRFIDQMFRHSLDNHKIVPWVTNSTEIITKIPLGKETLPLEAGFLVTVDKYRDFIPEGSKSLPGYVKNTVITLDQNNNKVYKTRMYRFLGKKAVIMPNGNDTEMAYYIGVEPLGNNLSGIYFSEFSKNDDIKISEFPVNNLSKNVHTQINQFLNSKEASGIELDNSINNADKVFASMADYELVSTRRQSATPVKSSTTSGTSPSELSTEEDKTYNPTEAERKSNAAEELRLKQINEEMALAKGGHRSVSYTPKKLTIEEMEQAARYSSIPEFTGLDISHLTTDAVTIAKLQNSSRLMTMETNDSTVSDIIELSRNSSTPLRIIYADKSKFDVDESLENIGYFTRVSVLLPEDANTGIIYNASSKLAKILQRGGSVVLVSKELRNSGNYKIDQQIAHRLITHELKAAHSDIVLETTDRGYISIHLKSAYNKLLANSQAKTEGVKPREGGLKLTLSSNPSKKSRQLKDQKKANLANALIAYGIEGSSTYGYMNDAVQQKFPVNETIVPSSATVAFVSVNGNEKLTEENKAKTLESIKKILDNGGTIIMDSNYDASRTWNKSGEGVIQKELGTPSGKTKEGFNYWGNNPESKIVTKKVTEPSGNSLGSDINDATKGLGYTEEDSREGRESKC